MLYQKFEADLKIMEVLNKKSRTAYKQESKELVKALKAAKTNIEKFHKSNVQIKEQKVTTAKGFISGGISPD